MAKKADIIAEILAVEGLGATQERLEALTVKQLGVLSMVKDHPENFTTVLESLEGAAENLELKSELKELTKENEELAKAKSALSASSDVVTYEADGTTYKVCGAPFLNGKAHSFEDVAANVEVTHPTKGEVTGLADYLLSIKSTLLTPLTAE